MKKKGWPNIYSHDPIWYICPEDSRLDMDKLLTAFQEFFRKHSEHWVESFDYKEAGPQLLLQAFLQRIVNGGGCEFSSFSRSCLGMHTWLHNFFKEVLSRKEVARDFILHYLPPDIVALLDVDSLEIEKREVILCRL